MDLVKDQNYEVSVRTSFQGRFSHYEDKPDGKYAVFVTVGVTDKGNVPYRRIRVENVVQARSLS